MIKSTVRVNGVDYTIAPPEQDPKDGDRVLISCQGCGRLFFWGWIEGGTPPRYHGKSCRERNRVRRRDGNARTCPHPAKRRYATADEAQVAFQEHTARNGFGAQPYHCRCGFYHLGNVSWVLVDAEA